MTKHVAEDVPAVPGIDLSFRPSAYFGVLPLEVNVLARITGYTRREILRIRLAAGDHSTPRELTGSTVDDGIRQVIGRLHPQFMGGEYLPPLWDNETEIARISLDSTTADQISVRARWLKDCIGYRIVDEYYDESFEYVCRPGRSKLPLTMAELVGMIDGGCEGGVALRPIVGNVECGADPDDMRDFVSVSSEFYPQLGRYYAHRIDQWFEANHPLKQTAESPDQ